MKIPNMIKAPSFLLLAALLILLLCPLLASAQTVPDSTSGLRVQGVISDLTVEPGKSYQHKMVVSIGEKAPAYDLKVEVMGLGQGPDGSIQPVAPDKDVAAFSARQWVTVDKASFHLEPGRSQDLTATITVPNELGEGGRYAVVYISTVPKPGGNLGIALAAAVPILIAPSGGKVTHTGKISNISVEKVVSGQPIEVVGEFHNSGNHHFRIDSEVVVTDGMGKVIASKSGPLGGSSVFPGQTREVRTSFGLLDQLKGLAPGSYQAEWKVSLAGGQQLDSRKVAFQVTEAYRPFPGIDEADLVVVGFKDEEPKTVDARRKADTEVSFAGTGKVTGTVVVGKYKQEPEGKPRFSATQAEGGTGKTAHKFIGVGVQGFSQGTATITVYYQETELKGLNPNSLFLSYKEGEQWIKLHNPSVLSGTQAVRGELPVSTLNRNPVIVLGGSMGESGGAQAANLTDMLLANWPIVGGLLLVMAGGPTLMMFMMMRRKSAA